MKKNIFMALIAFTMVVLAFLFWCGCTLDWISSIAVLLPAVVSTIAVFHARKTYRMMEKNGVESKSMVLSVWVYVVEIILPYPFIAGFTFAGVLPFSTIIIFLTLPVAIACAKTAKNSLKGGAVMIADLDSRTANLQMMFSVLFAVALVVNLIFSSAALS